MFRKKEIALTASRCQLLEIVRLALEVLTGERVQLHELDFQQENYFFRIGQVIRRISFSRSHNGRYMHLGVADEQGKLEWSTARFDGFEEEDYLMKVMPTFDDSSPPIWWVGRSHSDRWQEPLYPSHS